MAQGKTSPRKVPSSKMAKPAKGLLTGFRGKLDAVPDRIDLRDWM
jgi:hypothetical protein